MTDFNDPGRFIDDRHPGSQFYREADRINAAINLSSGSIAFDSTAIEEGAESFNGKFFDELFIENHTRGVKAVNNNAQAIAESASLAEIDPDLLSAVVYLENARGGLKDDIAILLNKIDGLLGIDLFEDVDTHLPGNVNVETWGDLLGIDFDHLDPVNNPADNIELTAKVLSRLQELLPNPTPEAIATLYNGTGKDKVTSYGLTVGEYKKERPRETPLDETSSDNPPPPSDNDNDNDNDASAEAAARGNLYENVPSGTTYQKCPC